MKVRGTCGYFESLIGNMIDWLYWIEEVYGRDSLGRCKL
jgi:hypothetical protein